MYTPHTVIYYVLGYYSLYVFIFNVMFNIFNIHLKMEMKEIEDKKRQLSLTIEDSNLMHAKEKKITIKEVNLMILKYISYLNHYSNSFEFIVLT